jgi:hypothetical protein
VSTSLPHRATCQESQAWWGRSQVKSGSWQPMARTIVGSNARPRRKLAWQRRRSGTRRRRGGRNGSDPPLCPVEYNARGSGRLRRWIRARPARDAAQRSFDCAGHPPAMRSKKEGKLRHPVFLPPIGRMSRAREQGDEGCRSILCRRGMTVRSEEMPRPQTSVAHPSPLCRRDILDCEPAVAGKSRSSVSITRRRAE